MRKMIALMLALVLALSMAACVGQADPTEADQQTTGKTDTVAGEETAAETPEQTEEQTTEVPETTEEPEKMYTVDEVPIPEELWEDEDSRTDENSGSRRYFIKRNLSAEVLADYRALLIEEGFVITETTLEANVYAATATQGNVEISIYFETADLDMTAPDFFKNGGHFCDKSIFEIQLFVVPEDVYYAARILRAAVPTPEWSEGEVSGNKSTYTLSIYGRDLDRSVVLDYTKTLQAAGYTTDMEEYPEGNPDSPNYVYSFSGRNEETGISVSVNIQDDGLVRVHASMRK